jgi:hypothetical protein
VRQYRFPGRAFGHYDAIPRLGRHHKDDLKLPKTCEFFKIPKVVHHNFIWSKIFI